MYDTISNLKRVQRQAHYTCPVKVLRDGQFKQVDSSELVPGDIIQIPEQNIIPCDLILLQGTCVMNESMLTGESIPAIKNALPKTSEIYDKFKDAKYTLYGGTSVVQTRKSGD
jgi:cation-transporting ATPase 13A3/4/5